MPTNIKTKSIWANKWVIVGILILILVITITLILVAYFWGRKNSKPRYSELFANSVPGQVISIPDTLKELETNITLTKTMLYFKSYGFLKSVAQPNNQPPIDQFMLINTIYRGTINLVTTKPNWFKTNLKYLLDYGIGKESSTNSYYFMTFENEPKTTNKYYGIVPSKTCSISMKPVEFIDTNLKKNYYFPGYTYTYYIYNDKTFTGVKTKYEEMMKKYTKPITTDILTTNTLNTKNAVDINIMLKGIVNQRETTIIPVLIDEDYLEPDSDIKTYIKIADDNGTGGERHSIWASLLPKVSAPFKGPSQNFMPLLSASSTYFPNYMPSPTNTSPIKSLYNWRFNSKMTDFLNLELYPETNSKYNWGNGMPLEGRYWLTINSAGTKFITEVIKKVNNTNVSSLEVTDFPETPFKVYEGIYTENGVTSKVYKYVSGLTDKIIAVNCCNDTSNISSIKNKFYFAANQINSVGAITSKLNIPADLDTSTINDINSNGLWHNFKKPWYIFSNNKLHGALTTSNIYSVTENSINQVICTTGKPTISVKPELGGLFHYKITIPEQQTSVISNIYTYPAYPDTYFKIIPYISTLNNNEKTQIKYYRISTYGPDINTNDITFNPLNQFTRQIDPNKNIFFRPGYFTMPYLYVYNKHYAYWDNTIIPITDYKPVNDDKNYIEFKQYSRKDPIIDYIEDADQYTIKLPEFSDKIFKRRTKPSEKLNVFTANNDKEILYYDISVKKYRLMLFSKFSIFDSRYPTSSKDTFIWYNNQVRFTETSSNIFGLFEFPLQTKSITNQTFAIVKYVPITTTTTTTTVPVTTESTTTTTTTVPVTTESTTTTTTTVPVTTESTTTTTTTTTVPVTTESTTTTTTTVPVTTESTTTTTTTTTTVPVTTESTTTTTTTAPVTTESTTTTASITTIPNTTPGITRAANVFGFATVPITIM